jgi:hypothetical protein
MTQCFVHAYWASRWSASHRPASPKSTGSGHLLLSLTRTPPFRFCRCRIHWWPGCGFQGNVPRRFILLSALLLRSALPFALLRAVRFLLLRPGPDPSAPRPALTIIVLGSFIFMPRGGTRRPCMFLNCMAVARPPPHPLRHNWLRFVTDATSTDYKGLPRP